MHQVSAAQIENLKSVMGTKKMLSLSGMIYLVKLERMLVPAKYSRCKVWVTQDRLTY